MYSPSLLSMILHSLWTERESPQNPQSLRETRELVALFKQMLPSAEPTDWPQIPVTAWSADAVLAREFMGRSLTFHAFPQVDGEFFWGRVPVNELVNHFEMRHAIEARIEYLDLGTPLEALAQQSKTSAGVCDSLLQQTNPQNPRVRIGFVDQGRSNTGGTACDYSGRLNHLVTQDIDLSTHAESVLRTILERLKSQSALQKVGLTCSLVQPAPKSAVGLACFDHDNTVELQHALLALETHMQNTTEPWSINLSLGTHVGPHNGDSPIEEFVSRMTPAGSQRYFMTSAGNHGQRGVAAFRRLRNDVPEDLILRTGSAGTTEMLVEFWWREPQSGTMSVEVMVRDASGKKLFPTPLTIDSQNAATTMSCPLAYRFNAVVPATLFHASCRNDMSCAAFAVTTKTATDLADLDLEFRLRCVVDRIVNAWITITEDRRSTFVAGSPTGTLTIPSPADEIIAVSGVDKNGLPWTHSSRGPAGTYDPSQQSLRIVHAPRIAHLIDSPSTGDEGTSFSSARACADAAALLQTQQPTDAADLVRQLFRQSNITIGTWDPRIGYGAFVR